MTHCPMADFSKCLSSKAAKAAFHQVSKIGQRPRNKVNARTYVLVVLYHKLKWNSQGQQANSKYNTNKTGVINAPLGQTHSLASSDHCFLLFCFANFEKWGRTDNMCKNKDPYRPWLWVGRVDQKFH